MKPIMRLLKGWRRRPPDKNASPPKSDSTLARGFGGEARDANDLVRVPQHDSSAERHDCRQMWPWWRRTIEFFNSTTGLVTAVGATAAATSAVLDHIPEPVLDKLWAVVLAWGQMLGS